MDIPSTSYSQKSPTASTKDPQGKEVPSPKYIRSVEPELESLGAVGGEDVSFIPDVERSAVAILPTKLLSVSSLQETEEKLFYGTYPVLSFTQENLDDVNTKIRILAGHLKSDLASTKMRMAALKVQELITRRVLGQCDDEAQSTINKTINRLSDNLDRVMGSDPSSRMEPSKATNPVVLWNIDDEKYADALLSSLSRSKKQAVYAYVAKDKEEAEKNKLIAKQQSRESIPLILELVKKARFKQAFEDPQKKLGGRCYYFDEEELQMIDADHPGLRAEAKQYGIEIMLSDVIEPSDFEKKLFACHQLYREYTFPGIPKTANVKHIDCLHYYKDQLRDELTTGKLTACEAQQLAFLLIDCTASFFQICIETVDAKTRLQHLQPKVKAIDNKRVGTLQDVLLYCQKCLDLTKWAKDNGFLHIADFTTLQLLCSCVALQTDDVQGPNKKLLVTLAECEVYAARVDSQKRMAFGNYISISEMVGDEERFDYALEVASQYTLVPLLIRIWHDLGLAGKHHRWTQSDLLRPEYAIEYLEKICKERDKLLAMMPEMDKTAEFLQMRGKNQTPQTIEWAPRTALYYYLTNNVDKGKDLLKYGNVDCHTFFSFLSLIAESDFEGATTAMENALAQDKKNVKDRRAFKRLQQLRPCIIPLLGILHKKLADSDDCKDDERIGHLKKALVYLTEQVTTHKELYLAIAEIQEKLNDLQSAYDSYDKLEQFFREFPQASYENCQLYCISQAKERLRDLLRDLAEDVSPKQEDSPKDITSKELEKPKKSEKKEKRAPKTLTTESVAKLAPRVEETVLPSTSLSMEQVSKVDIQDKVLAVSIEPLTIKKEQDIQEDDDKNWELVVRKKATYKTSIADTLTEEVVERQMRTSRYERYKLYNELLLSVNVDYDKLLARHDSFDTRDVNITLKLVILQNKMWTLRHKSFNAYALDYESNQTGVSVMRIKIDLRRRILETLYSNIEDTRRLWTSEPLPATWKTNPETILKSEAFQQFREDKNIAARFWIQLGAQFSTIGHIMQDIYFDQPKEEHDMQHAFHAFGRNLSDFQDLSTLFYQCRNSINPEHQSLIY